MKARGGTPFTFTYSPYASWHIHVRPPSTESFPRLFSVSCYGPHFVLWFLSCFLSFICSVVPLPFLYLACSFLNLQSTPLLMLSIIILHGIFATTESKVMPVQLLLCFVFPFFAGSMMSPRLQLFGIFSYCHIVRLLSVSGVNGVNSGCFPIL